MKNRLSHAHILLSRTDNIGDVILTLPMAAELKQYFPHCRITFLAQNYVKPIVEACQHVDAFLSWDELQQQSEAHAIQMIQNSQFDIVIHVLAEKEIGKLMVKAGIPWRIGAYHRWHNYFWRRGAYRHWFYFFHYNRVVKLNRARDLLHEAQMNLKLLQPLGIEKTYSLEAIQKLIQCVPRPATLPEKLSRQIDAQSFNLIIHPFSNNHAKEWPIEYYEALISSLPSHQFNIFITGSEKEGRLLPASIKQYSNVRVVCGELTLNELMAFMLQCDGLLAASTGPLHMAAVLGLKALGLFPPAHLINPMRWAPLGEQAQYLTVISTCRQACQYPDNRTCACMKLLDVEKVKTILQAWLLP